MFAFPHILQLRDSKYNYFLQLLFLFLPPVASAHLGRGSSGNPANRDLYGPLEGHSVLHGCNRAAGEVWCGGECVMPDATDSSGALKCLPPGVTEFAPNFAWGAATASYQIEGAVAADGRGATIWDTFSHTPGKTRDGDTGDIADDHYHKWRQDIEIMQGLGLSHYRFSIAWSRILPQGGGEINEAGLVFYEKLVDDLVRAGIEPFVTLYHWDLPQALHDAGGWHSPDPARRQGTIDAFAHYAGVVFGRLAPRGVKHWLTFNEPYTFVRQGYSEGNHAPGRCSDRFRCAEGDSWTEPYVVAHEVLRAHARAVELFRSQFQPVWGGEIGITLNADWPEPADVVSSSISLAVNHVLIRARKMHLPPAGSFSRVAMALAGRGRWIRRRGAAISRGAAWVVC